MMISRIQFKFTLPVLFIMFLVITVSTPQPLFALFGNKIDSFTADQVELSPQGKVINTVKLYVTPEIYRLDGMPGGGRQGMPAQDISMFIFMEDQQHYFYNHDRKVYFQTRLEEDQMAGMLNTFKETEQETIIGNETVSDFKCVIKKITTTVTMMGMKHTSTMTLWESENLPMPLRTKMEDGSVTELRNIQKGHPGKKYFQRPEGYQKVGNMMEVFGMDFMDQDEEDTPSDAGQNMPPADMEAMMEAMKAMGKDMDPEQMEQMQQAMAQAMNNARQTREGKGAADGLWKLIPKKTGDTVVEETYTPSLYTVIMGTDTSLEKVFAFYQKALIPKGWQDGGKFIQNGFGHIILMKGDQQLLIATADDPGSSENFSLFYNIQLTGPDL